MKLLVVSNQVPFIRGGAEAHAEGLIDALLKDGHEVELIRLPFKFEPASDIEHLMQFAKGLDLRNFNGHKVDGVISLLFPGFGVQHPNHVSWVIHQHRSVYDLYSPELVKPETEALKKAVTEFDTVALTDKQAVFANSANVAKRLKIFNGIDATPLYHPPPFAERFYCSEPLPYVFFPSRIELLKRQDLLLKAAALMKSNLGIVFSGQGSRAQELVSDIERYQLQGRVRYVGSLSEEEKLAFYARSAAVFFGPVDEDLGYVTLEAMLSSKPVITCEDSGGPLEFVSNGVNGWVTEPNPQALANTLDSIAADMEKAKTMGKAGLEIYKSMGITWANVSATLTGALGAHLG